MSTDFAAIILAAGQGTRMQSDLAKVLHQVADRPLVGWSVEAALDAGASRAIVVVGHQRDAVTAYLRDTYGDRVEVTTQHEQLGTGHAVMCAMSRMRVSHEGQAAPATAVILYGDCPLIEAEAIRALLETKQGHPLAMLVSQLPDPQGYGRIIREHGRVIAVREQKDATPAEQQLNEVNPGVYAIDVSFLSAQLDQLESTNAAGEIYLTDLVAKAATADSVQAREWPMDSLRGINDRAQLAWAESAMQARLAHQHALGGVTIRNPASCWFGAEVKLAKDVTVESHVVLRGKTRIASGAHIDVGSVLDGAVVEAQARVKPYSVVLDSVVGAESHVGPFAHLRPGTTLGRGTRIGNFVETKKTTLGEGSKAGHLAYLGDGEIGAHVNIGAGTIFCNYDGVNKHVTRIQDDVFVGSDSQLVAPLTLGAGSYVATGTTVTRDVPENALAVGRAKQENKEGYASKLRARFNAQKKARK